MKSTTKSCSTYLSQKRPQFLHTVNRMLCPLDLSPVPEYCVHSVLTGCRHSMQMAILIASDGAVGSSRRSMVGRREKMGRRGAAGGIWGYLSIMAEALSPRVDSLSFRGDVVVAKLALRGCGTADVCRAKGVALYRYPHPAG